MNDNALNTIMLITSLLYIFITAICIYKFYMGLFHKKEKYAFLIPLVYFATMTFLKLMPWIIDSYLAHGIGVLSTFMISYVVYKKNTPLKLYLSITFLALTYLIHYISTALWNLFFSVLSEYYLNNLATIILIELAIVVLKWITLITCISIITKKLKRCTLNFSLSIFFILVLPSIISFLGGVLISNFYYDSNISMPLPYSEIIVITIGTLFILSIITNAIMFQNIKKNQDMEKDKWYLEKEIEDVSLNIQKTERMYADINGLKHDLKNHSINIKHLIDNKQYEEAKKYVKEFDKAINYYDYKFSTKNPVTDVIINEYANDFYKNNIAFESQFIFPQNTNISAFDISVILNNALENALEACKSDIVNKIPEVKISAFRKNNTYLIQIENTFSSEIIFDEAKIPQTQKSNKQIHGMGLKNIESIAKKYHGGINIDIENNTFVLLVMLITAN